VKTEQEIGIALDAATWAVLTCEEAALSQDLAKMNLVEAAEYLAVTKSIGGLKHVALALSWVAGRTCPDQELFNGCLDNLLQQYNNRHNTPVKKRRRKKK
jgi:hypothetical protein